MAAQAVCECGYQSKATTPGNARRMATSHRRICDAWSSRATAAGLTPEHTVAEWVAHPTALDDLMRVMGGTSTKTINIERRREVAARELSA